MNIILKLATMRLFIELILTILQTIERTVGLENTRLILKKQLSSKKFEDQLLSRKYFVVFVNNNALVGEQTPTILLEYLE